MKSAGSLVMIPLRALYSAVTRSRLAAYRSGLFSVSKLAAPVISVGNLTTGGTGKTPLVEWICRTIAEAGASAGGSEGPRRKKVCVLTRGYGRANPQTQVVVSNGTELLAGPADAGDEPLLLARNLLGTAAVICNPSRLSAGEWAVDNLGSDAFVLDDGFQHLRVSRDLDIVTIDATNPWGGGVLLPEGRLREPVTSLTRADCVVLTRTNLVENPATIKEAVRQHAGNVPIFLSRMLTSGFRSLEGESVDKADVPGRPVGAFCGIGNPDSFFEQLRREGCELAFKRSFADHHRYRPSELVDLAREAKSHGAEILITTAKDAVKLNSGDLELPCYVLEIQISIDEADRLAAMIHRAVAK